MSSLLEFRGYMFPMSLNGFLEKLQGRRVVAKSVFPTSDLAVLFIK